VQSVDKSVDNTTAVSEPPSNRRHARGTLKRSQRFALTVAPRPDQQATPSAAHGDLSVRYRHLVTRPGTLVRVLGIGEGRIERPGVRHPEAEGAAAV